MSMLARYIFCRSVLEEGRTYTLYADRLEIEAFNVPTRIYPLAEVRKVHLKYEHTKQREYYQCFIHTPRGRIDLRHVSYVSFGKFEDRRASYTPFVKALLAEVARVPGVQFRAGSMVNFIGAIVGAPLMAGLAWLCISLGRIALAIFAGVMGGIAMLMIGPSRPRRFDPLSPPPDLLPE